MPHEHRAVNRRQSIVLQAAVVAVVAIDEPLGWYFRLADLLALCPRPLSRRNVVLACPGGPAALAVGLGGRELAGLPLVLHYQVLLVHCLGEELLLRHH